MSSTTQNLEAALQRAKAQTASMTEVYNGAVQTFREFVSNDAVSKAAGAVMSAAIKNRENIEALERVLEAEIAKRTQQQGFEPQQTVKEEGAKPQQQLKAQAEGSQSRYTAYSFPSNRGYSQQQQSQDTPSATNPRPVAQKPKTPQYDLWWSLVENAFFNYPSMSTFPEPPTVATCQRPDACAAEKGRTVKACDCQVEAAFRYLVEHYGRNLRTERVRWHPDRFVQVREELKQEFTAKANEVFRVVNRMYEVELKSEAGYMEVE